MQIFVTVPSQVYQTASPSTVSSRTGNGVQIALSPSASCVNEREKTRFSVSYAYRSIVPQTACGYGRTNTRISGESKKASPYCQ